MQREVPHDAGLKTSFFIVAKRANPSTRLRRIANYVRIKMFLFCSG
jgi:hypothetical protein